MAYIVKQNGTSGYSRADFLTALGQKQDTLESGVNVKTINGLSVLGDGNLVVETEEQTEYTYDLNEYEAKLKRKALAQLNGGTYDQTTWMPAAEGSENAVTLVADNPVDPDTGKRKYLSFGFISDLHTHPTTEEIQADPDAPADVKANWPTNTGGGWYYGQSCEPSLKLLGAVAHDAGLNAVVCGGDFSSGQMGVNNNNYNCYTYMLHRISKMFRQYISVPYFTVEGNHDRQYVEKAKRRSNDDWLAFLKSFNRPRGLNVTYIGDTVRGSQGASNCYYIDLPSYKIRLIFRSQYEKVGYGAYYTNGAGWETSKDEYFPGDDKKDYTLLYFTHTTGGTADVSQMNGWLSNGDVNSAPYKGSEYYGRACVGAICGHLHQSAHLTTYSTDVKTTDGQTQQTWFQFVLYHISNAFSDATTSNSLKYCFSVITIDTDKHRIIERKVGRVHQVPLDSGTYEAKYGAEESYIRNYPFISPLEDYTIQCVALANTVNQYKLSVQGPSGTPYVRWSIPKDMNTEDMKNYVTLNPWTGVLTVKAAATEAKTFKVKASSGNDKTAIVTIGAYVQETEGGEG